MSNAPVLQVSSPPDLLRRFVPLPNELCIRGVNWHLHFRTNEPRLAAALGEIAVVCAGDSTNLNGTIVCDSELPPQFSEGMAIETNGAVFLSFGRACLIAIDREHREFTGFVAAELLDGMWSAKIAPALMAIMTGMR